MNTCETCRYLRDIGLFAKICTNEKNQTLMDRGRILLVTGCTAWEAIEVDK
jgi:hypothetical protein